MPDRRAQQLVNLVAIAAIVVALVACEAGATPRVVPTEPARMPTPLSSMSAMVPPRQAEPTTGVAESSPIAVVNVPTATNAPNSNAPFAPLPVVLGASPTVAALPTPRDPPPTLVRAPSATYLPPTLAPIATPMPSLTPIPEPAATPLPPPTPTPEPTATPPPPPTPEPVTPPRPAPSVAPRDDAALHVRIEALLAEYGATDTGIAGVVIGAEGDESIALNDDRVFATASLYKLFVLWGVQRAIATGDLTADTLLTFLPEDDDSAEDGELTWAVGDQVSVAELREAMITTSNNSAAWVLARTVGWWQIDQLLQAHGFSHSRAADGASTPREIARFFDRLLDHTLDPRLGPADYATMLDLLLAQKLNAYLSPGFPPRAVFAHKTGNLPGVINDAGILYLPDGRTVTIVVMTEGDEAASFALLRQIAAAVWDYYTGP